MEPEVEQRHGRRKRVENEARNRAGSGAMSGTLYRARNTVRNGARKGPGNKKRSVAENRTGNISRSGLKISKIDEQKWSMK